MVASSSGLSEKDETIIIPHKNTTFYWIEDTND